MKKYFLLGLMIAIAPNICFGAGARYTQLVREKQRKMQELEKCMGATNGLKIAGLSTIGLTAVGVAGNVAQAKKLDEYESGIESKQKELEKVNKDIAEKQAEIKKEKEAEEAAATQKKADEEAKPTNDENNPNMLKNVVKRDIAAINATPASLGAKIYVSGYNIDQLPEDLYDDIYSAMEEFTSKCDENEGWFGDYPDDKSWGSNYANTPKLNPDDVWEYTERYVLAQCVQN